MLTPQSPSQLRAEAKAHEDRAEKLRSRADAISISGARGSYADVNDQYEELSAEADAEFVMAMKLYRKAHATENYERQHAWEAA